MLSPEAIAKIDYELTKYPADQRQAAVMSALRIVQTERGWLSKESITEVAGRLQQAGVIRYRRGHISVLDRAGLEHRACECYAVVKGEQRRLLASGR